MPKRMAVLAIDEELLPGLQLRLMINGRETTEPAAFHYSFVAVGDQAGKYVVRKNTTNDVRLDGATVDKMLQQLDDHLSVSLDLRAVQPEGSRDDNG